MLRGRKGVFWFVAGWASVCALFALVLALVWAFSSVLT